MRWPLPATGRPGPVALLLSGTALAQGIGLLASPALTRLFGPESFGALAAFSALLGFFAVMAGGRYEMAILLPAEPRDARALMRLACTLAAALSAMLLLLAFVLGFMPQVDRLAADLGWPGLLEWRWLLPPAVFLSVALAALGAWLNRAQRYGALAASRVGQALVAAGVALALGALGDQQLGLIWGTLAGLGVGCLWLLAARERAPEGPAASMPGLARRYVDFPRVNLPHALLDSAQTMVLVALLGAGWGTVVLGLYALALRVVRAPLAMIGSASGQVFQQQAARAFNEGRSIRPALTSQWRANAPWLLLLAAVCASAPWTFEVLFGAAWREAGVIALVLLPWMAASLVVAPLSGLPLVLGRQRGAFGWGLAYHAAMVGPLVLAWAAGLPARAALLFHAIVAGALLMAYAAWLWRISDQVVAKAARG